jgi:hypothetical protein
MAVPARLTVLAHTGGVETGGAGELAMTIMLVTVLVAIWVLLGVVCWIFWRAKKREDEARRPRGYPPAPSPDALEREWRNAPSS